MKLAMRHNWPAKLLPVVATGLPLGAARSAVTCGAVFKQDLHNEESWKTCSRFLTS